MMKIDIHAMTNADDVLNILPEQIRELTHLIGLTATLKLVDKFGGLSFEIPHSTNTKNGTWLMRELGDDIAQVLIDHHKGEKLYINNCNALRVYLRNQALVDAILTCMETGTSQHRAIQETAPQFGITERRAYEILKEMTKRKAQIYLF